jgi:hypothetical protein
MEWATRKLFSSPADKVSSHGEDKQKEYSSQAAEVLYEFLAPRHCPAEHAALLQLSGFGNSVRGNAVFDMFLSCSSQDKPDLGTESWHKTTCIYERSVHLTLLST